MNKEWSEANAEMQALIKKESTFKDGIAKLIELRGSLFEQITQIVNSYPEAAFSEMPFPNANGYHSKTLAYSIWHIFRIEDIVMHTLIENDEQLLFSEGFLEKTHSPIITTGNELQGKAIADFSRQLDISQLYEYAKAVMLSTNDILLKTEFSQTKRKFTESDRQRLIASGCISDDESAAWLVDYWCGKSVGGLIKMPFSRHWIMHIEAMLRIKNKLCKTAQNKSRQPEDTYIEK